jgi:P27 family predicted phage terminase small subunit
MKLFEGNPGQRRLNRREPTPTKGRPPKPRHLEDKAKRKWEWLVQRLGEMGVLTMADGLALELLADAYGEYREARAVLRKQGLTFIAGDVVRPRPEVQIANKAWARVAKMLIEFGLTPSARVRLQVESTATNDAAEDERLLG